MALLVESIEAISKHRKMLSATAPGTTEPLSSFNTSNNVKY